MTPREFTVDEGAAGQRLDLFLAGATGLSRSQLQQAIRRGAVTVNQGVEPARYTVRTGDVIQLAQEQAPAPTAEHQPAPQLNILYEDADMIVIDKPAGLAVHPGAGSTKAPTVADFARLHTTDPDPVRPGIVHRLDKDTSGALIIAKTPESKTRLQDHFKHHRVEKTYFALVHGRVTPAEAVINVPLGRSRSQPLTQGVRTGGKPAVTAYKVLATYPGYSLVEAQPKTGRTHQLRVHFQAVGHPIAGDKTYGPTVQALGRQFLHAASLIIPTELAPVHVTAPLPKDLTDFLSRLSKK